MASREHDRAVDRIIGELLWSQWRTMGVNAAAPAHEALIDPEALIVETVRFARGKDPRLYNAAVAWAREWHLLVATPRLKRLQASYDEEELAEFEAWAGHVAARSTKPIVWKHSTPDVPVKADVEVRLPLLKTPALMRLRTRAIFGPNARAESVAFLATTRGREGTDLLALQTATGYAKRNLADHLEQLALAGLVERFLRGNSLRFVLAEDARVLLRAGALRPDLSAALPQMTAGPFWVDWPRRYALLRVLRDVEALLEHDEIVAATARARSAVDGFRREGIPELAPLPSAGWTAEEAARVADWISYATQQLASGQSGRV